MPYHSHTFQDRTVNTELRHFVPGKNRVNLVKSRLLFGVVNQSLCLWHITFVRFTDLPKSKIGWVTINCKSHTGALLMLYLICLEHSVNNKTHFKI